MCDSSKVKITVISDISFESFFTHSIDKYFEQSNLSVELFFVGYNEYLVCKNRSDILNSDIVVVFPSIQLSYYYLNDTNSTSQKGRDILLNNECSRIKQIYSQICDDGCSLILWFEYEDYYIKEFNILGSIKHFDDLVDRLNNQLSASCGENAVIIDTKFLIASVGINDAFSYKNLYRWNQPYSQIMIDKISAQIYKQFLIENGISKKCIVVDCDGVLWGGILSEDGIENIKLSSNGLGRPYWDFQHFLLFMHDHGVILSVCSKNDESDVMCVFEEHDEMILRKEHIAYFSVNWNNKVDNIRNIANNLNISLDSIVLIDDSEFEIQFVKTFLPEVESIKFDRETVYNQLSCFNLREKFDVDEIKNRHATYKSNVQRKELMEQSASLDQFIESLDLHVYIHEAGSTEYSRISELTQRANKCTNGVRCTVGDIKRRECENDFQLYSVTVSDKFSDLGLVGTFAVEKDNLYIFCLSCRALNRGIENKMIDFIKERLKPISFTFLNTGKNDDLLCLLECIR
ncbi:MAG: HAD-IIIC family phosphatase [Clostridia bacterium]|nr:HAD-IIIC family phosphatase [Clostridia bacterium]